MAENFMCSSELHHHLAISYHLWLLGWKGRHIDQNVRKASIGKRCLSGISTLFAFHQMEGEVGRERSFLPDHHSTEISKYILLHSFIDKPKSRVYKNKNYYFSLFSITFYMQNLIGDTSQRRILNSILYDFVLQKVKNCNILLKIKIPSD